MDKNFKKSLLYTLPMSVITFLFMTRGSVNFSDPLMGISLLAVFLLINVLYFLMHFTGKTDRYRAILFILFALSLSFSVINHMLEVRNSMSYSRADLIECKQPFCHLVIPMMILPAAFTKSIIFPGSIIGGFADISSMVVIWLVSIIVLGRGFCSWGCFYGGWDDGFSRFRKRPLIKHINTIWKWMPFAMLLMVMLTAAMSMMPTYCRWICPFKAVTEFEKVTSVASAARAGIFLSLFGGLVVALPIMTGKRSQCSFLCPLGAINTLSNKITPFTIKIDKASCNECYRCIKVCPLYAISKEDIKKGEASVFCSKCGKCTDICPNHAIHFGIKGIPEGKMKNFSRNLFLFVSFLFMSVFAEGSIVNCLHGLLKLIF
jgi:polyferredoxin